jgi:hypothetical protein
MILVVLFVALLMAISTIVVTRFGAGKQAGAESNPKASDHGRGLDDIHADGTQHVPSELCVGENAVASPEGL